MIGTLILSALILIAVAVLAKHGEKQILETVLLSLVVEAEKQYGNGTGATKLAAVVDWLYQRIPPLLQPLFTAKELKKLVEAAVGEAQEAWAKNGRLKSYINQGN